jgi:hypothetical protein
VAERRQSRQGRCRRRRLLQIDADNLRALANRAYVGRTRAMAGDAPRWRRPSPPPSADLRCCRNGRGRRAGEADFAAPEEPDGAVFDGTLGFAALQAKQYDRARERYLRAIAVDPDNLPTSTSSRSRCSSRSRAMRWASGMPRAPSRSPRRAQRSDGREHRQVRPRALPPLSRQRGGWPRSSPGRRAARSAARRFRQVDLALMTPAEAACRRWPTPIPATMSFSEWALVLASATSRRPTAPPPTRSGRRSATSRRAARGSRSRSRSCRAPDRHRRRALRAQPASNTRRRRRVDGAAAHAAAGVGATISVVGSLSDYQLKPFLFRMTRAELAEESLPVAGGACADPRPQMCTRDYRPTCGVRRDGTRRTYGNACTACADPEVVVQGSGVPVTA